MRPLVAALFTLAVAASVLAGDGLVLVPHTHGPGTPAEHPHGLALYRFPIALLGEPADAPRAAVGQSSAATIRMAAPLSETLAGMSLLLVTALVVLVIAAPRPLVRRLNAISDPRGPQWSAITPTGPPRLLSIV